ncbi:AzlD domain-containing protein [Actinomarinicola tropica]|uniref:AzlD domain-containing protein n=2 Tax=Actinomarinicola tropica TaxID=2789776 RepID=A0A5Q2RV86_9ACTN|nr:AzlD domain-containing protein [Actinomarinicola tropica]
MAVGAYAFKAIGLFAFDARPPSPKVLEALRLLPPALLGALIVVQTVATGEQLVVDARLAGVLAGGYAAWRKAPFVVVLVVAAAVTAGVRALS